MCLRYNVDIIIKKPEDTDMAPFKTVSNIVDTRSTSILWHGMEIHQAATAFDSDELKAYSKHRFWTDGRTRHDRMPDYETSNWFCGWCMSRSLDISQRFGSVIFAFDRKSLNQTMKIVPLTYGRTIQGGPKNHKRELEEFVTNGTFVRSPCMMQKEYDEEMDAVFDLEYEIDGTENPDPEILARIERSYNMPTPMDYWMDHHGKPLPISKSIGFFVDKSKINGYGKELFDQAINHPKFLGFL